LGGEENQLFLVRVHRPSEFFMPVKGSSFLPKKGGTDRERNMNELLFEKKGRARLSITGGDRERGGKKGQAGYKVFSAAAPVVSG